MLKGQKIDQPLSSTSHKGLSFFDVGQRTVTAKPKDENCRSDAWPLLIELKKNRRRPNHSLFILSLYLVNKYNFFILEYFFLILIFVKKTAVLEI